MEVLNSGFWGHSSSHCDFTIGGFGSKNSSPLPWAAWSDTFSRTARALEAPEGSAPVEAGQGAGVTAASLVLVKIDGGDESGKLIN